MDTRKTDRKNNQSDMCCGHRKTLAYCIVRMLVVAAVLTSFFVVGLASGANVGGMMSNRPLGNLKFFERRMPMRLYGNDAVGYNYASTAGTKTFGVITKIETNKITVSDNGAGSRVILSQSSTTITMNAVEVGLASLKVGQNISVVGTLDKDGQMLAEFITVISVPVTTGS